MQHINWVLEEVSHGHFNTNDPEHCRRHFLACNELLELQSLLAELRDEAVGDDMPLLATRIQNFL